MLHVESRDYLTLSKLVRRTNRYHNNTTCISFPYSQDKTCLIKCLFLFLISLQTKHKSTGEFAALKQVDITNEEDLEDYSVEIDILESCKHENIVALYESFYFADKLYVGRF